MPRKYRPSNGTEGCAFMEYFCERCIHEKFIHTMKHGDAQCNIADRSLIYDLKDPEYPEEWIYDDDGHPTCTAWKKWDWGNDDDENGLNEPPPVYPDDPNQLCLPFLFEELENQVSCPKEKELIPA